MICTPQIEKLIDVEDAYPEIVLVPDNTCLQGITVVSFAEIIVLPAIDVPFKLILNVPPDAVVFTTIISVTIVVVDDGTVYNDAFDVAAAPRNRTVGVVDI